MISLISYCNEYISGTKNLPVMDVSGPQVQVKVESEPNHNQQLMSNYTGNLVYT